MTEEKRRWRPPVSEKSGEGDRALAQAVRKKNVKPSSKAWLQRQLNDPYVRRAQAEGLRSRAAFKLLELDQEFHLIEKGARVLDLGAAPGGWMQIAQRRGAAAVVGVDLLAIEPLPGAAIIQGDVNDEDVVKGALAALGGPPDLVLADMAANTTGHAKTDQIRTGALAEMAAHIAMAHLAPGGAFVTKAFQGGLDPALLARLKQAFKTVRHAKPKASRAESVEIYVVAKGFRGGAAPTATAP